MPPRDENAGNDLLAFEQQAWDQGYKRVAGIDEAGRGPLAGPVVAAAVIFPPDIILPPVRDSKQLTAAKREELAGQMRQIPGIAIGVSVISASEIDQLNILRATHQAMREAVRQLHPPPDFVLIDGLPVPAFPLPHRAVVKGDTLSASIAAASIIAKVHRDQLLRDMELQYPGYGFARHKGYGTRSHLAALKRLGPTPEHRRSFAPVQECLNRITSQPELPEFPKS